MVGDSKNGQEDIPGYLVLNQIPFVQSCALVIVADQKQSRKKSQKGHEEPDAIDDPPVREKAVPPSD